MVAGQIGKRAVLGDVVVGRIQVEPHLRRERFSAAACRFVTQSFFGDP
jgi:hypothetical protein